MARQVSVAAFQQLQRSQNDDTDSIDPAAEDAASAEALRRIGAPPLGANIHGIGPDTDGGPNPDYDPTDGPIVAVADHLVGLGVERECTAEMSLHMITERVRDAARERLALQHAPTENDVVLEAERIWVSLDRQRSHTYSVEQDGTIRDWRRPDNTPDRGPDVGSAVHQLDDDGQRFSGAGAEDDEAERFPVPSDAKFNGRLYRDAPELADIAEGLIGQHGFLSELINCEIRYYWRRKTGVSKGRVKIGYCKRASDLLGHFSGADFIIWLSATTARDGKFTPRQVEAAIFHQLLHIETDDEGNFISARHDFEGFAQEIRTYGVWTEDLKVARSAFRAGEQMGLFDMDDDGIEDDEDLEDDREEAAQAGYVEDPTDGAGVLVHADGTPMTAEEIEAQEAAELADDEGYPRASDLRCGVCNEPMVVESAEHDAQLAAKVAKGEPLIDICERCGEEADDEQIEAVMAASGSPTSDEGEEVDILTDDPI